MQKDSACVMATKPRVAKLPRRKLYVMFVKDEVKGMSPAYSEEEACRLFAAERRVPVSFVTAKWTGNKTISLDTYNDACKKQIAFLGPGPKFLEGAS
jgi:hypothetical protein